MTAAPQVEPVSRKTGPGDRWRRRSTTAATICASPQRRRLALCSALHQSASQTAAAARLQHNKHRSPKPAPGSWRKGLVSRSNGSASNSPITCCFCSPSDLKHVHPHPVYHNTQVSRSFGDKRTSRQLASFGAALPVATGVKVCRSSSPGSSETSQRGGGVGGGGASP